MLATHPPLSDRLVEALIEAPQTCMGERTLLQAIDWRDIDSSRVERLVSAFSAEGIVLPGWLVRGLLLGGHHLSGGWQGSLDSSANALNELNRLKQGDECDEAAWDSCTQLSLSEDVDPQIATAAVRRMVQLGTRKAAARLALAHYRCLPQLINELEESVDELIDRLPAVPIRLTGYSTTHTFGLDLAKALAALGFRGQISEASFGQTIAELMQPPAEARDALMVLLDLDALYAPEWREGPVVSHDLFLQKLDQLTAALESYAQSGSGPVIINTLPIAAAPTAGLIDLHHPAGVGRAIQTVNQQLAEIASANSQVILVDSGNALADVSPRRRSDPKLWYYGRIPYSPEATRHLAVAFAGAFRALKRGTAKVLALDLDNTLWGGVFGEDGVAKLLCDDEFPGNAFKAFQRECLRLKNQGFLLALLSKNNADAITAFSAHPGMLLREDDFVATRINWEPKPSNIRSIADELNLGLDSFVFIDDSPHEREAMRRMCPELTVPELPTDPASRPSWLRALTVTWPTRLTDEDSRRSEMYLAEKRRAGMRETAASFQDYLKGLDQVLLVRHADAAAVGRIAQMHLRTNQFNLTTERYDEAVIAGMLDDGEHVVLHGQAIDKFGDHGVVICATARVRDDEAQIRSFLMSCRVVGRTIETAFLGALLGTLEQRGVRRIKATYIPTKKNALVRDFYRAAGFLSQEPLGEAENWLWCIGESELPRADEIELRWEN